MRVIAGTARSIPLVAPEGKDTRPTTDRIKETLFNILQNEVNGAVFFDVFAGSGGIGIEALSRGAAHAYFIDNSKTAIDSIMANLRKCRFTESSDVMKGDAGIYMERALSKSGAETRKIIFMDPPYGRSFEFPVLNVEKGKEMIADIEKVFMCQDSVGGIVECVSVNVPAGIGSPIFDGLENSIASLIFGIPAVKGLEFGVGFNCAKMLGSENNDEFYVNDAGHIVTRTNNHGGILGGISSGMPISLRVAFKPTPSISKPQHTVDMKNMSNDVIQVKGRHDPCIVPRAVPVVEAAVNIALLSHMLDYPNF